jgi:TPR repeat protein
MNNKLFVLRVILPIVFALSVACPQMSWASTHVTTKEDIDELEKAHSAIKNGQYIECYNGVCHVADRGHPQAQQLLGHLYEKGIGVEKNAPKAVLYYEKAAKQGVGEAQMRLGVMLRNGEGVAKNPKQAEKWLKRASKQNIGLAQYHLGQMYLHGEVSSPNLIAASNMLRRAAANGVKEAETAIADLPPIGGATRAPTGPGIAYQENMDNLTKSWQGYADMVNVLREVDAKASAGM